MNRLPFGAFSQQHPPLAAEDIKEDDCIKHDGKPYLPRQFYTRIVPFVCSL